MGARFAIGDDVLVDEGLAGRILAVREGMVPTIDGEEPGFLYIVDPEHGAPQVDIPEYNLMLRSIHRVHSLLGRLELCALGWELDAERYRGRRRQWRLDRAQRLWRQATEVLAEMPAADFEFELGQLPKEESCP